MKTIVGVAAVRSHGSGCDVLELAEGSGVEDQVISPLHGAVDGHLVVRTPFGPEPEREDR